ADEHRATRTEHPLREEVGAGAVGAQPVLRAGRLPDRAPVDVVWVESERVEKEGPEDGDGEEGEEDGRADPHLDAGQQPGGHRVLLVRGSSRTYTESARKLPSRMARVTMRK